MYYQNNLNQLEKICLNLDNLCINLNVLSEKQYEDLKNYFYLIIKNNFLDVYYENSLLNKLLKFQFETINTTFNTNYLLLDYIKKNKEEIEKFNYSNKILEIYYLLKLNYTDKNNYKSIKNNLDILKTNIEKMKKKDDIILQLNQAIIHYTSKLEFLIDTLNEFWENNKSFYCK